MKITVDRDEQYAPCSYLICRVAGPRGRYDWDTRDETNTVLIQTDWDYPSVARQFGWRMPKPCRDVCETDGTVRCAHHEAGYFISQAQQYLDKILGRKFIEDPGYFDEGAS